MILVPPKQGATLFPVYAEQLYDVNRRIGARFGFQIGSPSLKKPQAYEMLEALIHKKQKKFPAYLKITMA